MWSNRKVRELLKDKDAEIARLTDLLAARTAAELAVIRSNGHKPAAKQVDLERTRIPSLPANL